METASRLTIPQLSYQVIHRAVLKWLLGLNPRSLPVPLWLVAHYLAGLLWVTGAATCAAMAAAATVSHDALRRLLIGDPLVALVRMIALTMVNRGTGYLVLDDVTLDKTGDKMAGIAWLYSSSLGKKVLALNPVVMGWTDGEIFVPLSFRFWKPPMGKVNGKPSAEAFDGTPFRTKLEIAIELLAWARQRGFTPTAVLFDAYYLAKPVIRFLRKAGWQWVSRIKGNRNLKRNGKVFKPQDWPRLAKPSKVRRKSRAPRLTRSIVAELAGWGPVRVIAVRHKSDKEPRYLVGSNPAWGRGRIEALYGHRWAIEVMFRDTSQLLGLHDCQFRSFRAQENHVALAFVAYLFLNRQARCGETAGETKNRLKAHAVVLAAVPGTPKVRRVKKERRQRQRDGGVGRLSRIPA